MSNALKKVLIFILLLSATLVITYDTCKAEGPRPAFNTVYTPKRIKAYKEAIRYFNPSVSPAVSERIAKAIILYSYQEGIEDDRFVAAVITIESMFNPYAVSRSGAMGLGQLMPGTARGLKVNNAFDIEDNVSGCCRYLKQQLNRYSHLPRQRQYELTLAAYNAGPGAVKRHGGIPPYAETQNYVVNVINVWRELSGLQPMGSGRVAALRRSAAAYRQRNENHGKIKITRRYIYVKEEASSGEN